MNEAEFERAKESIRFGPFTLNPLLRQLRCGEQPIRLGTRAFDLLVTLASHPGKLLTKNELLSRTWPDVQVDEGSLRVQMSTLRKTLQDASNLRCIDTIPGRGYVFVAPIGMSSVGMTVTPAAGAAAASHESFSSGGLEPTSLSHQGAAPAPVTQTLDVRGPGLPVRLGALIGREESVATIIDELPKRRLVTVVGPGGIGKSSVALAAAAALATMSGHAAVFVDIAAIDGARGVAAALASVLGISLSVDASPMAIAGQLVDVEMIVVLDNCEPVIEEAAALSEALLKMTRGIKLLVTSREPLRIQSERVHRLLPLSAPPATNTDASNLWSYPATRLLLERAQALGTFSEVSGSDVQTAAEICRRLDGIPFAIELAAAHLAAFGFKQLLEGLDDRFHILNEGRRTALPRHRTLAATFDWSYELLSEDEQRMLRLLAIFKERFSLEGAQALADAWGLDALTLLRNLVEKSLVAADIQDETTPYRLLESMRSYATRKLDSNGEREAASEAHALYMGRRLDEAKLAMKTMEHQTWLDTYARSFDDVSAALTWTTTIKGEPLLGARLATASAPLWFRRALFVEYSLLLKGLLEKLPQIESDPLVALRVYSPLANCLVAMYGPTEETDTALSRALDAARALGQADEELPLLWTLFIRDMMFGNYRRMLETSTRFGELSLEVRDTTAVVVHKRIHALVLQLVGDQVAARSYMQMIAPGLPSGVRLWGGGSFQVDHGATSLTLRARALWLQGRAHEARLVAAQARQGAIDSQHGPSVLYTLGYGCCPMMLWTDAPLDEIETDVRMLQEQAERTGMPYWQGWSRIYAYALECRARHPDEVRPLDMSTLQHSQRDVLLTMIPAALSPLSLQELEQAFDEMSWVAPEILRMQAEMHLRKESDAGVSMAVGLLERALDLAEKQGATAWRLRSAVALARVRADQGQPALAAKLLERILQLFSPDEDGSEVLAARKQLERLHQEAQ